MKLYYAGGAVMLLIIIGVFAFTYWKTEVNVAVPEGRSVAEGLTESELFGNGQPSAVPISAQPGMEKFNEARNMALSGGTIE